METLDEHTFNEMKGFVHRVKKLHGHGEPIDGIHHSGLLHFMYAVQQLLKNNYLFPVDDNRHNSVSSDSIGQELYSFPIKDLAPPHIGHLIGVRGQRIRDIAKASKCMVTLSLVPAPPDEGGNPADGMSMISATIAVKEGSPNSSKRFELVERRLKGLATSRRRELERGMLRVSCYIYIS